MLYRTVLLFGKNKVKNQTATKREDKNKIKEMPKGDLQIFWFTKIHAIFKTVRKFYVFITKNYVENLSSIQCGFLNVH